MKLTSRFQKLLIVSTFATLSVNGVVAATKENQKNPTQELTAQDQSTHVADEEVTRGIRQEIMKKDFSVAAKNITIITANGVVTLKGNVSSAAEKKNLYELAQKVAGQTFTIRNEIAVVR